jgi:hypothetical protein
VSLVILLLHPSLKANLLSCVLAGKESVTVLESGSGVVLWSGSGSVAGPGRGRGSGSGSVAVPWRGNESGCRSRSVPGRVTVSGCEPGTGTPAEERPEHHQGPLIIVPR